MQKRRRVDTQRRRVYRLGWHSTAMPREVVDRDWHGLAKRIWDLYGIHKRFHYAGHRYASPPNLRMRKMYGGHYYPAEHQVSFNPRLKEATWIFAHEMAHAVLEGLGRGQPPWHGPVFVRVCFDILITVFGADRAILYREADQAGVNYLPGDRLYVEGWAPDIKRLKITVDKDGRFW